MTVTPLWEQIAPALAYPDPDLGFPYDTLALVEAHWDELADPFLGELTAVADTGECDPDGLLHIFAMYLLAEHRDGRAHAPLLKLAAYPEATLDAVLGDVVTEGLGICLASTLGDAGLEGLHALALNEDAFHFARTAALTALRTRVLEGDLAVSVLQDWLAKQALAEIEGLRADPQRDAKWLGRLAYELASLGPSPWLDPVRGWCDSGLVDPMLFSRDDVDRWEAMGYATIQAAEGQTRYVRSTADRLAGWVCFQPETNESTYPAFDLHLHTPYQRETPKVGRNDPCPCGSGKKYKKCCGAA